MPSFLIPPEAEAVPATACAAIAAVRAGRISAEQLLRHHLAQIARHNPRLNAMVTLDESGALAAARAVDAMLVRGEDAGALAGLPVSIKDAFASAGLRSTCSHPPLAQHVPAEDATAVARWRAAGAVIMGKSNLPQLAGDPQCWSPLFGATDHPWRSGHTPGGSSGGSAVAIASGMSLLELGSDIAGSIRIPAAYCGVVGHKASENRIARSGHMPHLPGQARSVWHMLSFGAIGRSVADVALGFSVLAGPDGRDSTVPPLPVLAPAPPSRPLRMAWWDDFDALPLCPRTRQAMQQTVARLEAAGVTMVRIKPDDFDFRLAWQAFGLLAGAEIGLGMPALQQFALRHLRHLLPASHRLLRALGRGLRFDLQDYNQALVWREQLIAALERFLAGYDGWLCPVAPTTAYRARHVSSPWQPPPQIMVDGRRLPYFEATISLCSLFSLTGSPVVSLPLGVFDGLPVGAQLVGRRWQDEALLATAARLEALLPATQLAPGCA